MEAYLSELLAALATQRPAEIAAGNIDKQHFPWMHSVQAYVGKLDAIGIACSESFIDQIIENYIRRDLLFLCLALSSGPLFSDDDIACAARENVAQPNTLYLGSHDFYQLMAPALLARAGTALSLFGNSPLNIEDPLIRNLTTMAYKKGLQYLAGGEMLEVDRENSGSWRSRLDAVLVSGEAIYAAIDQFEDFMKVRPAGVVNGKHGQYRLVTGAIKLALQAGYSCQYVKVIFKDGRYHIRTQAL